MHIKCPSSLDFLRKYLLTFFLVGANWNMSLDSALGAKKDRIEFLTVLTNFGFIAKPVDTAQVLKYIALRGIKVKYITFDMEQATDFSDDWFSKLDVSKIIQLQFINNHHVHLVDPHVTCNWSQFVNSCSLSLQYLSLYMHEGQLGFDFIQKLEPRLLSKLTTFQSHGHRLSQPVFNHLTLHCVSLTVLQISGEYNHSVDEESLMELTILH